MIISADRFEPTTEDGAIMSIGEQSIYYKALTHCVLKRNHKDYDTVEQIKQIIKYRDRYYHVDENGEVDKPDLKRV